MPMRATHGRLPPPVWGRPDFPDLPAGRSALEIRERSRPPAYPPQASLAAAPQPERGYLPHKGGEGGGVRLRVEGEDA
jgi:hypothetical protein